MITEAASNTEQNTLPFVAVTMGDGAGVGPEVVVAAAAGSAEQRRDAGPW